MGRETAVDWDENGQPRSRLYGDVFYSRQDGLAETRAVFLAGCGLPGAWAGRTAYTVAELGLGTGLNVAALLHAWSDARPPGAHLNIFSLEADLMAPADAARALAAWPELAAVADPLIAQWPDGARGAHRLDFPGLGVTLDIFIGEAVEALRDWSGAADAWFLDGFSPALNPAMWRPDLLALVAARSAPDARLATYTVAGEVRRNLSDVGFAVRRLPGFGRKRERLEAVLQTVKSAAPEPPTRVAIIGAGIAGAALARAFADRGVPARVFGAADSASAAPAALVAPRLDAGLVATAALFAQALRRAAELYERIPDAILVRGAIQFETGPKDARRFAAIAASDLFAPDIMTLKSPGLSIRNAVVVEPARVLSAWIDRRDDARVAAVRRTDDGWRLEDEAGAILAEADVVCLAAGMGVVPLAPQLPLRAVRGQASVAVGEEPDQAVLFGGYAIPTRTGLMFGATHDRDDEGLDVRAADHARNLEALSAVLPDLAARAMAEPMGAHVGVRATTIDFLPLAGVVPGTPDGLFVLSGLGSRGFCLAPLLAEHVAALAMSVPTPLPEPLARLVDPGRFAARARRRGRPASRD